MGEMNIDINNESVETDENVISIIEQYIIALVIKGKSDSEMSDILQLNGEKLDELKKRLFSKTNANNYAELIAYAIQFNII